MMKITKVTVLSLVSMLILMSCGQEQKKAGIDTAINYSDKEAIANIFERKSVRKFQAREVEQEKIDLILRAGMSAPSGMDKRPWEIIVVTDREILNNLAADLPYAKMLTNAPMAMIVCGNAEQSEYWYLDCSAVSQNILLAAEALDLGAVWTTTYPFQERMDAVSKHIKGLPANIKSLNVIPIGYPDGEFEPKEKFTPSKVHYNEWTEKIDAEVAE